MYARRKRPSVISAPTIFRVASSIGTARPSPRPATAVLMPITRALESASAPPELPGFRAASVWITFSTTRPAGTGSERPSAETTPAVTVPPNPSGLPIATTSWPTRNRSASPSSAAVRPLESRRRTARSESGSAPMTLNSCSDPSANPARPEPSVLATTCAEVRRNPSGVITTALPPPSSLRPPRTRRETRRLATDGARRSATEITALEYASSASASLGGSEMNWRSGMARS